MGPLVTGVHRDKVQGYVDAGVEAGAELVVDGRNPVVDGEPGGFWLGPTLSTRSPRTCRSTPTRSSGRSLGCRVDSYDDALTLVNSNPYGNGTAIFTNDGGAARRYQNEVEVGMVGINVPVPVPVGYYSFGGWKASLFGDTHAHGTEGVQLLHPQQGDHHPVARPQPRRPQPRLPAERVSIDRNAARYRRVRLTVVRIG